MKEHKKVKVVTIRNDVDVHEIIINGRLLTIIYQNINHEIDYVVTYQLDHIETRELNKMVKKNEKT